MNKVRIDGEVQPGIKWGPFTLRIPFVHQSFSLSYFLQGVAVLGATGLALVPYFMSILGLTFEEAVVMSMINTGLLAWAFIVFGDPYAPGWITPAIPFVLAFITAPAFQGNHELQFQAMTALCINFAALLIFLGITGLGSKLINWVPNVLKGGIILGAASAAFLRVTKDGDVANVFQSASIAGTLGVITCLLFAFSKPLNKVAIHNKAIAKLIGFGLLPGFIVAGIIGYFTGEFKYNIRWEFLDVGAASVSLWQKVSPFYIGWPSIDTFIAAFPLALITYIIFFGDLVTGNEMIEEAQQKRSDEKLEINSSRTHMSAGIRNLIMGTIAPFFSTQGVLWTGAHVLVLNQWVRGKDKVNSIFDSLGSFYLFGVPFIFVLLPVVTLLQPLLPIALAVTLVMTAFACASLALSMVNDPTERGAMVITAMAFSLFEPWLGLLIGLFTITFLCGTDVFFPKNDKAKE